MTARSIDDPEFATAVAQRQVFRLEGEYWTIACDGTVCRLRDTKGLHLLAHLLGRPGERVPATLLLATVTAPAASPPADETDAARRTATERARVNVRRAIKGALQRIAVHHPALFAHLEAAVKTGNVCCYLPDPRAFIRWET